VSRTPEAASRAELFGWAMFDFANSSYTTVIVTVVYAVVFPRLIVGDGPGYALGNLYWSVALSLGYGLTVVTLPVLGVLIDASGRKKGFLFASYLATVLATAALYWATPGQVALAMLLVVVSNWAFAVGESFVAAFLPELGPPEALGRISGMAWGLGYLGGLSSTALVIFGLGPQTLENFERVRLVGPVTAAFFLVAALPTFLLLKERGTSSGKTLTASTVWAEARHRLVRSLATVRQLQDLFRFYASFFFAMAGLGIVIAFAFIFGDQVIRWSPSGQVLMFVVTQLTAAGGALAFGWVQGWLGDKRTYQVTLLVWILTVLAIAFAPDVAVALGVKAQSLFLFVGALAGLCLGATQSASRTLVAVFSPADRVGELFGLWGVTAKLASMVGLLSLGALQAAFGLERAVLVCAVFFSLALLLSFTVDEARGRRAAREA
jgi:MFS transporter, UMF1 family